MAGGWAPDGAEQAQIDANLDDALAAARQNLPSGESARECAECGELQGLMGAHKVLLLQASGGVFSAGPMAQMDCASSYLKTLLGGFLGFASVDTVYAEGTAGDWEAAVQRACTDIDAVYDRFTA